VSFILAATTSTATLLSAFAVDCETPKESFVQQTITRRSFVTMLGMFMVPLTALAQDNKSKDDKSKEEKKKDAKEKKDEAKDNAKDAVEDHDKVVDGPGTDRSQDRRQDRRRDEVKK